MFLSVPVSGHDCGQTLTLCEQPFPRPCTQPGSEFNHLGQMIPDFVGPTALSGLTEFRFPFDESTDAVAELYELFVQVTHDRLSNKPVPYAKRLGHEM